MNGMILDSKGMMRIVKKKNLLVVDEMGEMDEMDEIAGSPGIRLWI